MPRGRPKRTLKSDEVLPELNGNIQPYTGKESLPAPILNSKGKFVKVGGYRYECRPDALGCEFIAVFNKVRGIGRKLVKRLKNKRPRDVAMMLQLRKAGIPGA